MQSAELSTTRHTTHYLESGPVEGPLMIFVHGWPGIGLTWRAQIDAFASAGWHCVAPDMRGFGRSSVPETSDSYTIEEAVTDMVELHNHLGGEPAIWIGHDWGSAVVGALAAHQPTRARGAVLVSWAYYSESNSLATLVPLVDRNIYPADEYPYGQWDYYRYYTTNFESAVADLDADHEATLALVYRSGTPAAIGQVVPTATVTRQGGRFGCAHRAPKTDPDPALWPAADFDELVDTFKANGFRGSCAWYTNDGANMSYARRAPHGGHLSLPVLFVNGDWDAVCTIEGNQQGVPMREACEDLTVAHVPCGHWVPLESKKGLAQTIDGWLRDKGLRRQADELKSVGDVTVDSRAGGAGAPEGA